MLKGEKQGIKCSYEITLATVGIMDWRRGQTQERRSIGKSTEKQVLEREVTIWLTRRQQVRQALVTIGP